MSISSAWLEIAIGVVLFLVGYYIYILVNNFIERIYLSNLENNFSLFYILLITSAIGSLFFIHPDHN